MYALIDSIGKVTGRTAYDPYGNITYQTGTQPIMAYAGLYKHAASDLYLATYRAYNPATARWLNRDPIKEAGGLNVYAYVGGDPISLTDASGLKVYIGQHPAFINSRYNPFQHTAIVLMPNDSSKFTNHHLFSASQGKVATLGGQAFGEGFGLFGRLTSEFNYSGDNYEKLSDLQEICPPDGQSDTEFIMTLISKAESYDNTRLYDPFPDPFGFTFNSNSYVSGILKASGVKPPNLKGIQPGYNQPLPLK